MKPHRGDSLVEEDDVEEWSAIGTTVSGTSMPNQIVVLRDFRGRPIPFLLRGFEFVYASLLRLECRGISVVRLF